MIEGNGLLIRPLRDCPADIAVMARWLSDPRVLAFYEGQENPHDEAKVRQSFIEGKDPWETACIVEYQGKPLGYIQFYPVDEAGSPGYGTAYEPDTWATDQFIGEPECWGKGIGTAMLTLVLDYLVREKGARRVLLDPVVSNARAIRAYEKCGFRRMGILPRREYANGQWHDQLLMEYRPFR